MRVLSISEGSEKPGPISAGSPGSLLLAHLNIVVYESSG